MRLGEGGAGGLEHRRLRVEELHLGARDHHLADLPVAGLEDVLDDATLLLAQGLVSVDQLAQLLVAHLLALGLRVAAEKPDHRVRGDRQQPDDRAGDLGDPVDHRPERQREALRALQRQALGRELAQHQRQVGDGDGDQHQGGRHGHALGEAPVHEHRSQVAGQGGATERCGQEAGQGDADLDRGEEAVRVLVQLGDGAPALAAPGERAGLAVPQRDEGDLSGGEHPADEHEDHDQPDVRERAAHGL